MRNQNHVLYKVFQRYPQFFLPVCQNMRQTPEYIDCVQRGMPLIDPKPEYSFSASDTFSVESTPAGDVEVLILSERSDFIRAVRTLAYRCEPAEIPDSVGAMTIRGLINWKKIYQHRDEYLAAGGTDWDEEFQRFTSVKANYLGTIILLSSGYYSNVSAETVGLGEEDWKEKSLTIRKYHELTHFVCQTLYPDNIIPIRDEVIADMIGMIKAFGEYDTHLAEVFLGVEGETFREGGRLSHYAKEDINGAMREAKKEIREYAERIKDRNKEDVFALLLSVF